MFEYFAQFFFAIPIQLALNMIFVVWCALHYRHLKEMKLLFVYALLAAIQSVFAIYLSTNDILSRSETVLVNKSINLFMLAEYILFYLYIIQISTLTQIKRFLKSLLVLFVLLVVIHWSRSDAFSKHPTSLTLIESYLVITACLAFYYQLFILTGATKLLHDSRFWVVTGMMCLFAFLLPLFLQRHNVYFKLIEIYNAVYVINFLGYITLFTFFILGLLWKTKRSI